MQQASRFLPLKASLMNCSSLSAGNDLRVLLRAELPAVRSNQSDLAIMTKSFFVFADLEHVYCYFQC